MHAHSHSLDARRSDNRRRMWIALGINAAMFVVEVVGGVLTGSLAVLADAGHLLSDVGSIGLGLFAAALAARPAVGRMTFGYQRSEILAALLNGLLLAGVSVAIAIAAIGRLGDPPEIDGLGVLGLGLVGLLGNALAAAVLAQGDRDDVNLEGVLRHSAADALGSLGVVVAGAVALAGGPAGVDPAVSLLIAALILFSSWRLIVEPVGVLMEAAPADVDVEAAGAAICEEEGVRSVHDLHIWTVTSGFGALAAHVVVARDCDRDLVRRRIELLLHERFGIEHTTLQMEEEAGGELLRVENAADQL